MCEDKSKGVLGVKNLGLFNKALLGKWAWRFANKKKALWNQVIRRKYGEERGGWRLSKDSFVVHTSFLILTHTSFLILAYNCFLISPFIILYS